jgi:heat shock protein HslJ
MLHATEMAGSDDEMRAESLYLDLLRQAHRYSVTEAALTLKNGGNHEILIFHARW